ncbi:RagB/SusD family nutrient uptake outer membrane protein [Paraflavitalea soli]|uniref:RagB/SusD family nutrient uptake outer membrane protein n=1 Tax=Paraflavitalea soli TaxID=2315862 RepID=A0A3B7MPB2_9BACT|nr:RagB/SusD family nutrient uptake outer membrane protein [Paraflavitalea soli]AXY72501.1 RagB/SusD family nutrient uptake outer membrane protein [Paraflavitalea soli]
MFKMVKYFAFSLCIASLVLQGCSKKELVDLYPEFNLDALANPSNIKQVEDVLLGAYAAFRNANYFGSGSGTGSGWAIMPDVLSDNLYETLQTLSNSRAMADWLYQPNTAQVATLYAAPYGVIANANIVLRDIDKFTTSANQLLANRLKGQAYAMRAMAHFDLMRYFAVKYDRNSTTDLALYYSTQFIVQPNVRPARMSNKQYYDSIFNDLSKATTLLGNVDAPINPVTGLTRPYIDLPVINALLARIYLYAGMWPEAIAAATRVINDRPLVNLDQAAFSGMYNQTSRGEIIWNVQFETGQQGPTFLAYFATNGRSYFRPALEIATVAGTTGLIRSNDIRYSAFFTTMSGEQSLTKFRGKGTVTDGSTNFPVFRTGEMYLIRAEARARNAQEGPALDDLNALRAARINGYIPVTGVTGALLLEAIANERRRELVGEGHRFFDLKRTTRTITRGSTCGNQAISPAGDCQLNPTDREWTLPIPESVRNANENAQQNPDY